MWSTILFMASQTPGCVGGPSSHGAANRAFDPIPLATGSSVSPDNSRLVMQAGFKFFPDGVPESTRKCSGTVCYCLAGDAWTPCAGQEGSVDPEGLSKSAPQLSAASATLWRSGGTLGRIRYAVCGDSSCSNPVSSAQRAVLEAAISQLEAATCIDWVDTGLSPKDPAGAAPFYSVCWIAISATPAPSHAADPMPVPMPIPSFLPPPCQDLSQAVFGNSDFAPLVAIRSVQGCSSYVGQVQTPTALPDTPSGETGQTLDLQCVGDSPSASDQNSVAPPAFDLHNRLLQPQPLDSSCRMPCACLAPSLRDLLSRQHACVVRLPLSATVASRRFCESVPLRVGRVTCAPRQCAAGGPAVAAPGERLCRHCACAARLDRDEFVMINQAAIKPGFLDQYVEVLGSFDSFSYDYNSIMHYTQDTFSN
eukprot:gene2283-3140_t